jgi:hypothetical protein
MAALPGLAPTEPSSDEGEEEVVVLEDYEDSED